MRNVRVWFQKIGSARYISHLDLSRCMARAARRAQIPLWYTQGFNTHAYLTFALPLSLGFSGLRESMDLTIDGELADAELKERLAKALPPDLPILAVTEPKMKPGAIAFASYRIEVESAEPESLCAALQGLLMRDTLIVPKHTKNGFIDLDLKPELEQVAVTAEQGRAVIEALLPAGSQFNVNPALLLTAAKTYLGFDLQAQITRSGLFDAGMKPFE